MSDNRTAALKFAQDNQARFLDELKEFIAIPSISADPTHKPQIQAAAEWVAAKLTALGAANVAVMPTGGHPVVYGELMAAGPGAPTIAVYGHYDVQPPDPLDLWETGPFEATQRGDNLYGRGASDMKGQIMASLNAIEAVLKHGGLSVNIKFLIEGEEEEGSPNLAPFIEKHKDLLACDFALNPDSGMLAPDLPTISYSLRGLAYFEIRMSGPAQDLHSGQYGGVVRNPANELARLIGGMHDASGRITLPGFYDKVRELEADERKELARLPMNEAFYLDQTGAPVLTGGEQGFTPVERAGGRPTLDVNGIVSGFIGEGQKTVLPAKAMAKISMRLVPDQDPEEVHGQLIQYMQENADPGVTWEVVFMSKAVASMAARDSDGVQAVSQAMESVWGTRPVYMRVGGTIPVVGDMQQILGADSVLVGFGLPDDNLHSPNEKLHLPTWQRGIDTLIHFFFNLEQ
ncbi:MAG: dipeptidase [Anaerolineae bacterium]|nr:dipeptidase [Anaerolineae bacterium]